jgi:hypothetical protein
VVGITFPRVLELLLKRPHKGSRRPSHERTTNAFDRWWEWAEKPRDSMLTIHADIHEAVMALPPAERRDRAKVNEAVRERIRLDPLRPAGSADLYGVPKATK